MRIAGKLTLFKQGTGTQQDHMINKKGSVIDMINYNSHIPTPVFMSNKGYGFVCKLTKESVGFYIVLISRREHGFYRSNGIRDFTQQIYDGLGISG